MILEKVKQWLQEEIAMNEEIVSGKTEVSDGTEDVIYGRTECAEGLLELIQQWEAEWEEELKQRRDLNL